jgi:malate/lactate dehydrogenase
VVGRQGATTVIEPEMTEKERTALDRSADVIRRAAEQV